VDHNQHEQARLAATHAAAAASGEHDADDRRHQTFALVRAGATGGTPGSR